jgi:hypothetical protein
MAQPKIALRRSAREEILWALHVILDGVPSGTAGHKEFTRTVLRQFGVSWWNQWRLCNTVCAKLPRNLDEADMSDVLSVFEDVLRIEWKQDMVMVSPENRSRCREAVRAILSDAERLLPQEATSRILDELARIFGPDLSPSLVPDLHQALERLLIEQLWRCSNDEHSRERLTEWVIARVRQKGRLEID